MRKYIIILMTCCSALMCNAQHQSDTDKLIKSLPLLPQDTTKLVTLKHIIKSEQNNQRCIKYSKVLLKEATKQHNYEYMSLAAYYHTVYFYNKAEQDSLNTWVSIMEEYVKKSKLWDYYFDAKRFQIDMFTLKSKYELAIKKAMEMKRQASENKSQRGLIAAYQCMSNAYASSHRWKESLWAAKEAHKLLNDQVNPITRISVLTQLAIILKDVHQHEKMIECVKEMEPIINAYIKKNPSLKTALYDIYIFKELFYTHYYIVKKRLHLAKNHLSEAGKYLNTNTYPPYRAFYYDKYAEYYEKKGNYSQAITYINKTLIIQKDENISEYAEHLIYKARLLKKINKYNLAIPIYKKALCIKDSITTAISNQQMVQIKSNYKIETLELKQSKLDNNFRFCILLGIIIAIIASLIFMIRTTKVRRALKQSEKEIRKAARTVYETNEIKNRFLSNMSYNIRTPLNNVVGFSQLIASEPDLDEDTLKDYSNIIRQSSEELLKLVNDVLDLSRLESGMMKFQIQDTDVIILCHEAICLANMKNENKNIKINFLSEVSQQTVTTDATRFSNAIASALIEWSKSEIDELTINMELTEDEQKQIFIVKVKNSPLAEITPMQKRGIRHDINRLLFEHFGGSYDIWNDPKEGTIIVFTHPIKYKSE